MPSDANVDEALTAVELAAREYEQRGDGQSNPHIKIRRAFEAGAQWGAASEAAKVEAITAERDRWVQDSERWHDEAVLAKRAHEAAEASREQARDLLELLDADHTGTILRLQQECIAMKASRDALIEAAEAVVESRTEIEFLNGSEGVEWGCEYDEDAVSRLRAIVASQKEGN